MILPQVHHHNQKYRENQSGALCLAPFRTLTHALPVFMQVIYHIVSDIDGKTQRFFRCWLELLLSVFCGQVWLPVVNFGSHSSLVCNPKQSEPLRFFPMASYFRLCSWRPHVFSLLPRSTETEPQYFRPGRRFKVLCFSFIVFFFKLLIACRRTLLNIKTLQTRAHCGKDREKGSQYRKNTHVDDGKRKAHALIDGAIHRRDVSWQSEVMTPTSKSA